MDEIKDDLINLKIQKQANPKNIDFDNKIRVLMGKNLNDNDLKGLINDSDQNLKDKISNKFTEARSERIKLLGENQSKEIEKRIFLQTIDINWKSHIQYLEQLRQVIGLRSYGQRDPLIEYKKEAFTLFEELLYKLKQDYITVLLNLKFVEAPKDNIEEKQNNKINFKDLNKKVSRNEPCPCGSGKKYKKCCGSL